MANGVANLPQNWKQESWQGLIEIENRMRDFAEWNKSNSYPYYAEAERNGKPEIIAAYDELMQRASRYLAKAEMVEAHRNLTYPQGEPAPRINPKPHGDEPAILLAAAGIMERRGIHVTARKLIDMAHDIEKEIEDDDSKQARD